jgi:putative ATP-dependent endonuclease of the OLD family
MYLSNLHIKGFRGIREITLKFQKGLNVLVGENNCGKTSVADALRLLLSAGSFRRDISMTIDDFYCDNSGMRTQTVEIDATFSELTAPEQGVFIEMLSIVDSIPHLKLHIQYMLETRSGLERWRFKLWGGDNDGQQVSAEVLNELFYYVHLGALRDAERDLSPSRGNRLGQLFLKLKQNPADQRRLAETIQQTFSEDSDWSSLRHEAQNKVKRHLDDVSLEDERYGIDISFVPLEFRRIVETLQMKFRREIGETPGRLFQIEQNGLGYNNLLYIATVLGDLIERRSLEAEAFVALIIEEPEAHLHPQLQDTLFNFLENVATNGIQIFVTSHSPTVTAKTRLDSLAILHASSDGNEVINLLDCPLTDGEKGYLGRFMDVTKSQLFFAKAVILVEGISEALILPILAKRLARDLDKKGVEIINVAGTAFKPFAQLFNSEDPTKRLSIPCSLLTDDDSSDGGQTSPRAEAALRLAGGRLKVFTANKTLEFELWEAGNDDLLAGVYASLHPRTHINSANDLIDALARNNDKAVFAQELSLKLLNEDALRESFVIPRYISQAIAWAADRD